MLDNQSKLLSSELFYPKRFIRIFGHHEFRDRLEDMNLSSNDVDFLNEYAGDVLLSSEDFISLNDRHLDYLRAKFSDTKIVVIYAWRRASSKLYSIWQESIKHGGVDTFFEYHHNHLASPAQSMMLSADLKLKMFCRIFGKQNVKVLDYNASAKNDTLITDFLTILGREPNEKYVFPENNPQAQNRSMAHTDTEIIRVLNYMFRERKKITGTAVRELYTENYARLDQESLGQLKILIQKDTVNLDAGKYFIDQRSEKVITNVYTDNILNYEQPKSEVRITVAKQNWLLEEHVSKFLDKLYASLDELIVNV